MADYTTFMRDLITLAREHQTPYTCLILDPDGRVLAMEPNRVKQQTDATSHAEMNAIRKASKVRGSAKLSGCHLITTCEPCPMCAGAIYWSGIRRVTYGLSIPGIVDAGHAQLPARMSEVTSANDNGLEIKGGLLEEEVRALFS